MFIRVILLQRRFYTLSKESKQINYTKKGTSRLTLVLSKFAYTYAKSTSSYSDKEHSGAPKKIDDAELKALSSMRIQTQKELAAVLNVSQPCISQRLHAMGMMQKEGNWIPHELSERDLERRKTTCEILLQRQKRKRFLHRIITGDEKWIHYDNPKRPKAWVKPGEPGPSMPKRDIHGSKVMLCISYETRKV